MTPGYADGASFRQALEARLKRTADERHVPLNTLRQKVVMERLLARLFADSDPPWRLKGGFAMELRLPGRARTTRDLDLAAPPADGPPDEARERILRSLREAASRALGDFLEFAVAGPGTPLGGHEGGGFRFGVRVTLAGRPYAAFHVDVGFDAHAGERAEVLVCDDHLAFANLSPARVLVVPRERQFAEKLHAYTRPWGDRTNTRTKDLVDLLLLLELGPLDVSLLGSSLASTFGRPGSHPLPATLPPPPEEWASDYQQLAEQTGLARQSLDEGFLRLTAFWLETGLGEGSATP